MHDAEKQATPSNEEWKANPKLSDTLNYDARMAADYFGPSTPETDNPQTPGFIL
jgi:hypothetical protein